MPRRREVPKREILPDPKFGSVDLSKFMNVVMESGKKAVAESIIYGALDQVEKKAGKDPMEIFLTALNNEKSMAARLANELLEASEGRGGAMKKRDEVHRMAEANKAFSHFRF
jgi:small subunit ribosomal protein S7